MTTSLATMLASVYALTKRPDLVSETTLAIQNATLKAHRSDYYPKDLFEQGLQFDFSLTQQSLEYKTLIPRWRSLKYVRKFDYTTPPGVPTQYLELITPENVLDSFSINREDVCYLAGLELQIRCKMATQYFLLGCYLYPDVTANGYSSWIADEMPAVILYEAAAVVFKTIGYDEQASAYRQMVIDEYMELKQNIIAEGY